MPPCTGYNSHIKATNNTPETNLNEINKLMSQANSNIIFLQSVKIVVSKRRCCKFDIKLTKNIDEQNFNQWKQAAINNLHSAYPDNFKKMPKYYSWKQAMKFLDGVYRQNRLDKKDE